MRETNDTGSVKPVAPATTAPQTPPVDPSHPRAERGTFKEDGKDQAAKDAEAGRAK